MLKTVLKEVFVILLLSIALLLILAIVFYDYIPVGVTIPTKEAYETPAEVMNEINDTTAESIKTEKTYEVTDSDLNIYKQKANYTEGKLDPFALDDNSSDTAADNSINIQDTNKNQSNINNNNNNNSSNNNSSYNNNNSNNNNSYKNNSSSSNNNSYKNNSSSNNNSSSSSSNSYKSNSSTQHKTSLK